MDFVFNLMIVADFAQAFLNQLAGIAVTTAFDVEFVV